MHVGAGGEVLGTVTAVGPGGLALTLHPGTVIALDGGSVPAATDAVLLSLVAGSPSHPTLPAGLAPVASLRVALTLNGAAREAAFTTPPQVPEPSLQERLTRRRGAVVVPVTNTAMATDGSLGVLYVATPTGAAYVGSSAVRLAGGALPAALSSSAAAAGAEMAFDVPGTGSYGA